MILMFYCLENFLVNKKIIVIFVFRYRENIKAVSSRAKDSILPPLEQAVWWVEYVLRHKGARHIRPATLDLHWTQYLFIDVALFFISIISVLLFITFKLTKLIILWSQTLKSKVKTKHQ